MSWLISFIFDAVGGRALIVAGVVAALFAGWQFEEARERRADRKQGADNAVAAINRDAAAIVERVREARDAVDGSDAHERLRRDWCIDCGAGGRGDGRSGVQGGGDGRLPQ